MKTILKILVGLVIVIFAVDMCMDDTDTSSSSEETGVFDDNDEDPDAEAGDIYGNAIDDDGSTTATVSNWGDGTCRSINTKEFYQLVASKSNNGDFIGEGPVVVDFWADWCGYCKQIDPYLKNLAKKYKGKVQFYKVNADNCPAITNAYGIESLPTLFFCSGSDIKVETGARSEDELDEMISDMLK